MLGLLVLGTMVFVSCGKKDSPKAAFESFANSVIKGDYEKAIDFYAGNEKLTKEEKQAVARMLKMGFEEQGGIKSCEVLEEKISEDGQTAELKVKTVMQNGDVEEDVAHLIKTEQGWVMGDM